MHGEQCIFSPLGFGFVQVIFFGQWDVRGSDMGKNLEIFFYVGFFLLVLL